MECTANELYQIAEVEVIYKSKVKASQRPLISTTKDAYNVFLQVWDKNKIELLEEFKAIFLNKANRLLCVYHLSSGGITGTIADIRLLFSVALKTATCAIVVCHNHPSGNLKPSRQDEEITQRIKNAGKLLEIQVLDHIILSSEGYLSFADEGLL